MNRRSILKYFVAKATLKNQEKKPRSKNAESVFSLLIKCTQIAIIQQHQDYF